MKVMSIIIVKIYSGENIELRVIYGKIGNIVYILDKNSKLGKCSKLDSINL
jgi:hypothetical protein